MSLLTVWARFLAFKNSKMVRQPGGVYKTTAAPRVTPLNILENKKGLLFNITQEIYTTPLSIFKDKKTIYDILVKYSLGQKEIFIIPPQTLSRTKRDIYNTPPRVIKSTKEIYAFSKFPESKKRFIQRTNMS